MLSVQQCFPDTRTFPPLLSFVMVLLLIGEAKTEPFDSSWLTWMFPCHHQPLHAMKALMLGVWVPPARAL